MFKRTVLVLTLLVLFIFAVPALAGSHKRTGSQINVLFGTPTSFAADTAFYVEHGWINIPNEVRAIGVFDFDLYVDGGFVGHDFLMASKDKGTGTLTKTWVHNFPGGLPAGDHTFVGEWYGPCQDLVDAGLYLGTCDTPNQRVMAFSSTLVVTFGP